MANQEKQKLPPSREGRLDPAAGTGELVGDAEQIVFDAWAGKGTKALMGGIVRLELVMERDRSRSVTAFANLLRQKLRNDGYIVIDDIDRLENSWHEREVLGENT